MRALSARANSRSRVAAGSFEPVHLPEYSAADLRYIIFLLRVFLLRVFFYRDLTSEFHASRISPRHRLRGRPYALDFAVTILILSREIRACEGHPDVSLFIPTDTVRLLR